MFVVKTNGVFVSLCLRHALLKSMFAAIVVELRWNSCWCYTITQESALNDSRTRIIQNICQIDLDSLFLSTYEPDALFSVCVCCLIPHGMHFWHCSNSITVTIIDFIQCNVHLNYLIVNCTLGFQRVSISIWYYKLFIDQTNPISHWCDSFLTNYLCACGDGWLWEATECDGCLDVRALNSKRQIKTILHIPSHFLFHFVVPTFKLLVMSAMDKLVWSVMYFFVLLVVCLLVWDRYFRIMHISCLFK